ncbi:MAG: 5-(carboxyamino)imidazole ribonucleotide mutase [Acidimicrobiia bacterium]|nr:MAG: 5-(carboxyamino)imidazole ribonucleotide mutase [Acidimicrobiia bacterium]
MGEETPLVAVLVGSASDEEQIRPCRQALQRFGIPHEARVLSAHRTPDDLVEYVTGLRERGVEIVVAGAGMAAHLAGVVAAHTTLPVLGVPMSSGALQGIDALLSTVQMPPGVPVATLGIGAAGARNAAYLCARILAGRHPEVAQRMAEVLEADRERVLGASLPPID